MSWTDEAKVKYLMRLPWTIVPDTSEEGDRLLRVTELPAAVGCGTTNAELTRDFLESFEATLEAYVSAGEVPPLPAGVGPLPWTVPAQSAPVLRGGMRGQVLVLGPSRTVATEYMSEAQPELVSA